MHRDGHAQSCKTERKTFAIWSGKANTCPQRDITIRKQRLSSLHSHVHAATYLSVPGCIPFSFPKTPEPDTNTCSLPLRYNDHDFQEQWAEEMHSPAETRWDGAYESVSKLRETEAT